MTEETEEQKWRRKRRYPKILADEVLSALRDTDHLGHERTMELLELYRAGRLQMIADIGIRDDPASKRRSYFQAIPIGHLNAIRNLDTAFGKLHQYKNGGAGDYAAADVEKFINAERGKLPRKRSRKVDSEEVETFLIRRNYSDSNNKKAIISDAAAHFEVSPRTIESIASERGLTTSR